MQRKKNRNNIGSMLCSRVAAYFMGGTKYVKMEEVQTIQFPILWGLLYLAGLHLVCDYPFHMAEKTGIVQILSLRSQAGWWMEKLIWTYLTLVAYVGTIVLSICCFCLYRGIPFSSGIDSLTAGYINGFIAAGCLIFWFAAVKIKDNLPKEREEV